MRQIPGLVQTVDEKIGTLVGHLHTEKHADADLLGERQGFLIVGTVKCNLFLIGTVAFNVDVAVQKMIGNENAVIAEAFVIFEIFPYRALGATVDGIGVQVGRVALHE
jgi:hypothetical protein